MDNEVKERIVAFLNEGRGPASISVVDGNKVVFRNRLNPSESFEVEGIAEVMGVITEWLVANHQAEKEGEGPKSRTLLNINSRRIAY